MADDFNAFFSENTQWVEQGAPVTGSGEPPKPPASRREQRRRRERRRRRRVISIIAIIVVMALLICGGVFGFHKLKSWSDARKAAQEVAQIADYTGEGDEDVSFTVESGWDASKIAQALYKAEIIKSPEAFTSAAMATNATLYPGTFALKKHMRAESVLKILSDQNNASGFLEVRAGERVSDVIASAAQLSGIDQGEFDSIIKGGGSGILPEEAGGSFEGWFEPGAYNISSMGSASEIISAMVEKRIDKLDELDVPSGEERERILNIASIAEAEVNWPEYYGKVTRVIMNRLDQGITLGMDSTVAYGNNVAPNMVDQAMLDDASNPYNTRKNAGLPPTPISNPGDNAIKAALNPEDGDWLYFVTVNLKTGETKFTTGSVDEQNAQFEQLVNEYKTQNENAN